MSKSFRFVSLFFPQKSTNEQPSQHKTQQQAQSSNYGSLVQRKVHTMKDQIYDVCIVGSGPAGLACLSAIEAQYSLDNLNDLQFHRAASCLHKSSTKRTCVIDPSGGWMTAWQEKFNILDIRFLRSPVLASHPDLFDKNALLAYAVKTGRDKTDLLESGCADVKSLQSLGESQIGLWKLPSTELFMDFCLDLSKQLAHAHDYIQGAVVDIHKQDEHEENLEDNLFHIQLQDGNQVRAKAVILALGTAGRSIVPCGLQDAPRVHQWTEINEVPSKKATMQHVLVIGGGLTAVQSALLILRKNPNSRCVLCSRRELVERHFDINVEWFDRRTANKCMADFYHLPIDQRLLLLKESRGGGSVPPIYMKELVTFEKTGRLQVKVGNAEYVDTGEQRQDDTMSVSIEGCIYNFDEIVLACGSKPNCTDNPLVGRLVERWPIDIIGGFPSITEDCKWTTDKLFVVGSLGSLNIGPDAGNLMGIRRAAQIVTNSLDCRCWMRESDVLSNRFDVFLLDDETDSDDSSYDEE